MTNSDQGSPFDREIARIAVGGYDDSQAVRKSMMNRIRDIVRKRNEDIPFDVVEDEKDEEERDYDAKYADEELDVLIAEMEEENKLTSRERDYLQEMLETANAGARVEERYKNMMRITKSEPIYQEWLSNVYGVSHTLTARLIHQLGYCEDFEKPSNLWSYAGLAPGQERERGEKLNYNPDLKTLAWNVADCMIKQGENSKYRTEFYDPYKKKQLDRMEKAEEMSDEELAEVDWSPPSSRGHADARARRYLSKKVLKHYWAIARDLQGLDTPDEWVIAYGGHEKRTDTFENPMFAKEVLKE